MSRLGAFLTYVADEVLPDRPPEDATPADVAAYCGLTHPERLDDWQIPTDVYREQGGLVACERSGERPDPPDVVVARYELPTGDREILSHRTYADLLADRYDLDDRHAEALALHRAGWLAADFHEIALVGYRDPADVVREAKQVVESADAGEVA